MRFYSTIYIIFFSLILVTVTSHSSQLQCISLFEKQNLTTGLSKQSIETLKSFSVANDKIETLFYTLKNKGIVVKKSESIVDMLSEAADNLETSPLFINYSLVQKEKIWKTVSQEVQELLLRVDMNIMSIEAYNKYKDSNEYQPSLAFYVQSFFERTQSPFFSILLLMHSLGTRFETTPIRSVTSRPATSFKVSRLFSVFPEIQRKYSELKKSLDHNLLRAYNTIHPKKVESVLEINTTDENGHNSLDPNDRITKIKKAGIEIETLIVETHNLLQDKEDFAKYLQNLLLDTSLLMNQDQYSPSVNKKYQEQLKTGTLNATAVVKVFNSRMLDWGIPVHVIQREGIASNSKFLEIIKSQSTILDFGILEETPAHGFLSHIVQHDYILTRLTEIYGKEIALKKFRKLMSYLGTEDGVGFWGDLFDNRLPSTLSSPVVVNNILRAWFDIDFKDLPRVTFLKEVDYVPEVPKQYW